VETKIPIYEHLHHNITSTLSTTWWCWGKEVSMYKLTIIALASLKKLTLLVGAPLIGNQTQSNIITKWSRICIRKKHCLFVLFVCYFFALVYLCFLFVHLHICFCLFEFFFAHSCLFQTKKQSMIFVFNKKWSMTWESSNAHHKQDFLACLIYAFLGNKHEKNDMERY